MGATRFAAGPRSEAQSYRIAAEVLGLFDTLSASSAVFQGVAAPLPLSQRALTEDFARDSYENILFSLCRFHELTGRYPEHVHIVGFEFKRHRLSVQHMRALRYPLDRVSYTGIDTDDSGGSESETFNADEARLGEQRYAVALFNKNQFGCEPSLLRKRQSRNPFNQNIPYGRGESCRELGELIQFCGPDNFTLPLPWDTWKQQSDEGEGEHGLS